MSKWRLDGLHGQSQNPVKYVKKHPLGEVLVLQGGKVSRRPSKVTFRIPTGKGRVRDGQGMGNGQIREG